MSAFIKQEPRRRAASPDSPCAGRAGLSSTPRRRMPAPSVVSSRTQMPPTVVPDMRHVRSNAPSVATRAAWPAVDPSLDEEENDDIVFMEIRKAPPKLVKPEPVIEAVPPVLPTASQNDSLLNRNFRKVAENKKALGETLGKLQSLGIQHVVDLPSLVLVGDQSSGKSTLMSGIAGISLPHREGMCTRCPVHIRLSQSDTWRCDIALQQDFIYDGQPRRQLTKDKEFGPWSPQSRATKEFWSCKDKNDEKIKTAIRWAQVAILNHDTDFRQFVPRFGQVGDDFNLAEEEALLDEAESDAEATFSPNTVALDISGPGLADLSFYDLPGLIKTPRHEEDGYLVKVVENLAKKHISDQGAIILWAVPMNQDPENSSTLNVIRKQRAQARTVGIMTKADLLPQSTRTYDQWLRMLNGIQHKVGHSFFITARQPLEPGQPMDLQNSFEESFFNRQRPASHLELDNTWPKEFQQYASRCGLNALVVFLSTKLRSAFVECLPKIMELVEQRLKVVDVELSNFPDTPVNPYAELRESLVSFMNNIRFNLSGPGGDKNQFEAAWGDLTEVFRDKILAAKPKFIVTAPVRMPGSQPPTPSPTVNLVNGSDDNDGSHLGATPYTHRRSFQEFANGQNDVASATPKRPRFGVYKQEDDEVSQAGTTAGVTQSRTLMDIRRRIKNKSRQGAPDITPMEVYEELSLEAIALWDGPLDTFAVAFIRILREKIQEVLAMSFRVLRNRAAFRESQAHLDRFIDTQGFALKQAVHKLYSRECHRMYTLDAETIQRHKNAEDIVIRRHRHWCRWRAYQAQSGKEAPPRLKDWTQMSPSEQKEEEARTKAEIAKLGEEPFSKELEVCAYVRGYYLTAARRFIDSVVLTVISDFIPSIVDSLSRQMFLDAKLELVSGGQSRIDALMAEEPEVATKRAKLQDEQMKLAAAMGSIRKLEASGDDSEVAAGLDVSQSATNMASSFNPTTTGQSFESSYQPRGEDNYSISSGATPLRHHQPQQHQQQQRPISVAPSVSGVA